MNAADVLRRLGETLRSTATVKSVFCEPILAGVLEITESSTRFIPFMDLRLLAFVFAD
jgi:hypothetical protein